MYLTRHYVTVTCDSDGDCTDYTDELCNGYIRAIRYVVDTGSPIASTATITITDEESGLVVLDITASSLSRTYFPVSPTNLSSDGSVLYYTTAENAAEVQTAQIPIALERLKIVIDGGGTGLTEGGFYSYIG